MILRFVSLSTLFFYVIGQTVPCPEVPAGGCSVCGDGFCVNDKYALFTFPNQPDRLCGELESDAYNGLISRVQCSFLPAFVNDICGCGTESTPYTIPTPSPVAPAPTPTEPLAPVEGGNCPPIPQGGCSICGEGKCVNNKDALFVFPNQPEDSCGNLETDGRNGLIEPVQCQFYPAFVTETCGCSNILITEAPTTSPSDGPSALPTSSPTDIPSATPTTGLPSVSPTGVPSASPTQKPTSPPTPPPTQSPSATPTFTPAPVTPITTSPTTPAPTTPAPTTPAPTTPAPTTPAPTTPAPTTPAPTTPAPTTPAPTTPFPTPAPTPLRTCNSVPPEECPIWNTLVDANFFTILTGAMEEVGLDEVLSAPPGFNARGLESGFTVFAVADDQFDALSLHMECLLRDLEKLELILNFHIIPEIVTTFSDGDVYETLSGYSVTIGVNNGVITVNGAEMRPPGNDFIASNGIIHLIDEIIVPPDQGAQDYVDGCALDIPETLVDGAIFQSLVTGLEATNLVPDLSEPNFFFTIFAPADDTFAAIEDLFFCLLEERNLDILRDILQYHVVPGRIFLEGLSDGQMLKTILGPTVTISANDEELMINEALIKPTPSNVTASNGVIHLIEGLLVPPGYEDILTSICMPTPAPSDTPTSTPTAVPTSAPTGFPSGAPSSVPTSSPTTATPSISSAPTNSQTTTPSISSVPSTTPTTAPSTSLPPSISALPSTSALPSLMPSTPVVAAVVLFGFVPDWLNWLILALLIVLVFLLIFFCLWYFDCRNRVDDDEYDSESKSSYDSSSIDDSISEEEMIPPRDDDLSDIWRRNVWDAY